MPFDLGLAVRSVRKRHGDADAFRNAILDLLFAAGCPVRELAVALEYGDAVCIRTSGPAAPNAEPPLLLVAIDLDVPGGARGGRLPAWPSHLQSLGGSEVAAGWLTALRVLLGTKRQRPWEAVLVRGPALGLQEHLATLFADLPPGTEIVQLVPGMTGAAGMPQDPVTAVDLVRLELSRPRNIWRLPACDHTYEVEVAADWSESLPQLRSFLRDQGAAMAWTLHDMDIAGGHMQAVLRTSQPAESAGGVQIREVTGEQRLLFPVNDALTALGHMAAHLPERLAGSVQSPPWAQALPDGLCLHAVVAPVPAELTLPERTGSMSVAWRFEPLARAAVAEVRLALAADEPLGPVAAGVPAATAWHLPLLTGDEDLTALTRALHSRLG